MVKHQNCGGAPILESRPAERELFVQLVRIGIIDLVVGYIVQNLPNEYVVFRPPPLEGP